MIITGSSEFNFEHNDRLTTISQFQGKNRFHNLHPIVPDSKEIIIERHNYTAKIVSKIYQKT